MKPIFRIFSRVWFLNIIASFIVFVTLLWLVIGITQLTEFGLNGFINDHSYGIALFFGFLPINIWILTATFLPIIKINSDGISAYSIFWKRHIKWEEMRYANLMKITTRAGGNTSFSSTSVSFESTSEPETKNIAFLNKGCRVNTFIVVSQDQFRNRESLSLAFQLTTHGKLTSKREIAFEYDEKAWHLIQNRINKIVD